MTVSKHRLLVYGSNTEGYATKRLNKLLSHPVKISLQGKNGMTPMKNDSQKQWKFKNDTAENKLQYLDNKVVEQDPQESVSSPICLDSTKYHWVFKDCSRRLGVEGHFN